MISKFKNIKFWSVHILCWRFTCLSETLSPSATQSPLPYRQLLGGFTVWCFAGWPGPADEVWAPLVSDVLYPGDLPFLQVGLQDSAPPPWCQFHSVSPRRQSYFPCFQVIGVGASRHVSATHVLSHCLGFMNTRRSHRFIPVPWLTNTWNAPMQGTCSALMIWSLQQEGNWGDD